MFDATTIQEIHDMAIAAQKGLQPKTDRPVIMHPKSYEITQLEGHMANRYRFRGTMSTESLGEFSSYCEDNKTDCAQCFIDQADMRAVTIFNIGTLDTPGHCDHRAALQIMPTPEYTALLDVEGRAMSQRDAAEFLEEWRELIHCSARASSDTFQDMSVIQAIAAIRDMKTLSKRESGTSEGNFSSSRSALEQFELENADKFPAFITFSCAPYEELSERRFLLRVSTTHTEHKAPTITLRLMKRNAVMQEIAKEFSGLVSDHLADVTKKIYLGTFAG